MATTITAQVIAANVTEFSSTHHRFQFRLSGTRTTARTSKTFNAAVVLEAHEDREFYPTVYVYNENGNQVHSKAFDAHRAAAVQAVSDLIGQDLSMDVKVPHAVALAALETARAL